VSDLCSIKYKHQTLPVFLYSSYLSFLANYCSSSTCSLWPSHAVWGTCCTFIRLLYGWTLVEFHRQQNFWWV